MATESVGVAAESRVFETRLDVRWGDMDALHHVNNTVYFRYFEEARIRLFATIGAADFTHCALVLAHASCDFLKPVLYPASIAVGLKIVRVGRSSVEFECWVAAADDPRVVHARGRNVLVCVDTQTHRPVPWPPALLQGLRQRFSA